jgi:hypothetical protein
VAGDETRSEGTERVDHLSRSASIASWPNYNNSIDLLT